MTVEITILRMVWTCVHSSHPIHYTYTVGRNTPRRDHRLQRLANVTTIHFSLPSDDATVPFLFFFFLSLLFSPFLFHFSLLFLLISPFFPLFFLFSFFFFFPLPPPSLFSHLFPPAIGAFTLIKRPARDVYPGGVSVTS